MTDDPWRKPDPNPPLPPPAYGPPPGYYPGPSGDPNAPSYPPQYVPPGPVPYAAYNPAYNPYQAPLPQRGGYKRLLWILGTAGLLVLGGCGVGIWFVVHSASKNINATNDFLRDVRDRQFTSAYQRLCPGAQANVASDRFTSSLQSAVDRGHAVSSYDILSASTSEHFGGGSTTVRTAEGTVRFADGASEILTFELDISAGHLCVLSGYAALF